MGLSITDNAAHGTTKGLPNPGVWFASVDTIAPIRHCGTQRNGLDIVGVHKGAAAPLSKCCTGENATNVMTSSPPILAAFLRSNESI